MNKKILIVAAAVGVIVIVILTAIIVTSGKKEVAVEESPKENEQQMSTDTSSTTTPRIVTYTEIYGPTTLEPEDDIPPGNNVELNVRCLRRSGISLDSLGNIAYGNIGEDTSTKNYLLCLLKGMGILDRNGNFSVNASKLKLWLANIRDSDVDIFINTCKSKIGETPGDTAVLVVTENAFTTTLEPSSEISAHQTTDDLYLNRLMKKIRQTSKNAFNEVKTTNQDIVPKTDEERLKKIFSITFSCVSQTGITAEEVRQIRYGFIDENRSSKEFIFCFLNKFRLVNEDGEMVKDTDGLTKMWGESGDKEKTETVIAACRDKKADTPTDTAVLVYKCIKGMK